MVLKSGVIAWAQVSRLPRLLHAASSNFPPQQVGEPNGSIPTVQPFTGRPMWGALPASAALNSVFFVSKGSVPHVAELGLKKRLEAVKGCRGLKKTDMKLNGAMPVMKVDAESYEVRADGRIMDVQAASRLPLTRFYNVF